MVFFYILVIALAIAVICLIVALRWQQKKIQEQQEEIERVERGFYNLKETDTLTALTLHLTKMGEEEVWKKVEKLNRLMKDKGNEQTGVWMAIDDLKAWLPHLADYYQHSPFGTPRRIEFEAFKRVKSALDELSL